MIQTLIADAVSAGARQHHACQLLGVSARTLERWRAGATDDARHGPRPGSRRAPNQLTSAERRAVLATVNAADRLTRSCRGSPMRDSIWRRSRRSIGSSERRRN